MVVVAQLVRALDCGSRGRRFEPGLPPIKKTGHVPVFLMSIVALEPLLSAYLSPEPLYSRVCLHKCVALCWPPPKPYGILIGFFWP
jgi:hypothetical protein